MRLILFEGYCLLPQQLPGGHIYLHVLWSHSHPTVHRLCLAAPEE
uniref:Uncharacterized protein n=1 Tax=Anguilla anguilla TaxID=7936 RepID=A0A0E9RHT6_ANGAN